MKLKAFILSCLGLMCFWASAQAVPTDITVMVKTKDAKFMGTSMSGALITIRNAQTGEMLAKGVTTGGTGNTEVIMKSPHVRGSALSDEKSAKFKATIDIDEPTLVEVTAYGPLAQLQSANRASTTQWVIPGKDITGGDAWMMEIPGFVVDILAPPTHIKLKGAPRDVLIKANITMM